LPMTMSYNWTRTMSFLTITLNLIMSLANILTEGPIVLWGAHVRHRGPRVHCWVLGPSNLYFNHWAWRI